MKRAMLYSVMLLREGEAGVPTRVWHALIHKDKAYKQKPRRTGGVLAKSRRD
jgi:hypothetical protein